MSKKRLKKIKIIILLQGLKRIGIHKMNNLTKWSETDFKSRKTKNIPFKNKNYPFKSLYQLNRYQNQ